MRSQTIDSREAELLLSGGADPGTSDPGLAHLAALIAAAKAPASPDELLGEATVVAAMLKDLSPVVDFESRRASRIKKAAATQIAAAAVLALTATAAAAAGTGSLPGPAQSAVSHALAHIGIDVPDGHEHAPSANGDGASKDGTNGAANAADPQNGNGAGANANADFGLCTAFLASPQGQASDHRASPDHSQKLDATPFKALAAKGDPVAYCQGVIQQKQAARGSDGSNGGGQGGSSGQPSGAGKPATTGKPSTTPGGTGHQGKPNGPPGQNGSKPAATPNAADPGGSSSAGGNSASHPQGGGAVGGGQPARP